MLSDDCSDISLQEKITHFAIEPFDLRTGPLIRAQLLDLKSRKLEMDFVFQHDDRSMHVLNAVSPGFTCSLPFSRHICDQIG